MWTQTLWTHSTCIKWQLGIFHPPADFKKFSTNVTLNGADLKCFQRCLSHKMMVNKCARFLFYHILMWRWHTVHIAQGVPTFQTCVIFDVDSCVLVTLLLCRFWYNSLVVNVRLHHMLWASNMSEEVGRTKFNRNWIKKNKCLPVGKVHVLACVIMC